LSNGEEYYSDFQEMLPVTTTDSTWFLLEEESFQVGDLIRNIPALNVYAKINDTEETPFSQYGYDGIYEIESPLQARDICWRNPLEIPEDLQDTLKCYIDDEALLPLNIFSTTTNLNISNNGLKILTLRSNRRFELGYSMIIKKSSLTEATLIL
jgi:hypothetical protein